MKEKTIKQVCNEIHKVFETAFGSTPLRQRNEDILREAIELSRFTSIPNLKEEHGDLLCSLLMSFKENDWDPTECIAASLAKIKRRQTQYHAYGRKLNIAVLGGAFDPIHNGHVAVAEFLLNCSSEFDAVWIMPCYKHMYNKKMTSANHRLKMCELSVAHDRRIVVSDYEIVNKLGGETYQLVKKLINDEKFNQQYNFSFVIGLDNANTFDKWVNYEDLERMVRFVVVPRNGIKIEHKVNWYLHSPHMFLIPENPLPEISSTDIRNNLKIIWHYGAFPNYRFTISGDAYDFLNKSLNLKVINYIKRYKLYIPS